MEFLLSRYRNLTVLLVTVALQLILIAYQVRTSKDVPLLRVWAVTAVTPVERVLETIRRNTWGFVEDYFVLLDTRRKNEELQKKMAELKLENHFLRTELSTADRVRSLSLFQAHSPSKTVAARIIGNSTGANSKSVFVDRGSGSGIESGMAVVTPDGIVGKVVAAYPTASLVLLMTDSNFAAGVISQKGRVHGTLKGQGHDGAVRIDYIQNEEKVESGEWFYTSGDDRIFPKGFPVGRATTIQNGRSMKEIYVNPSGFQGGLEEVLIVLEAVHQPIPEVEIANSTYKLIPPPPDGANAAATQTPGVLTTDADRLKNQYRQVGDQSHYQFGEGNSSPDFTKVPGVREAAAAAANPPKQTQPQPQPGTPTATSPTTANLPTNAPPKPKPANEPTRDAQTTAGSTAASTAPKPKPRTPAPILVTDPTDADPSEPVIAAPKMKNEPDKAKPAPPKTPPNP